MRQGTGGLHAPSLGGASLLVLPQGFGLDVGRLFGLVLAYPRFYRLCFHLNQQLVRMRVIWWSRCVAHNRFAGILAVTLHTLAAALPATLESAPEGMQVCLQLAFASPLVTMLAGRHATSVPAPVNDGIGAATREALSAVDTAPRRSNRRCATYGGQIQQSEALAS